MGIIHKYGGSVNVDTASFEARVTTAESNIINHSEQLADIAYSVIALGCTINESDATNNTSIIQTAINQGKTLYFPYIIPINDTISIPASYSGNVIYGQNRSKSGLKMIIDNKPILKFTEINTQKIIIRDLILVYKNQQQDSNTESKAIYFYSSAEGSSGWYWCTFKRLRIQGAYDGIAKTTYEVVWGCDFEDIEIRDTINNAINLNATYGQLANAFKNIKILNYGLRDGATHNNGARTIIIKGEHTFDGLDIEDWWVGNSNGLYRCDDGTMAIKNVHIERIHITGTYPKMFTFSGKGKIENVRINDMYYESATDIRWFNAISSSTQLIMENINHVNAITNNASKNYFLGVDNASATVQINNATGLSIYDSNANPTILLCKKLIIDYKKFNEIIKYSTPPINIDVSYLDIFYNSVIAVNSNVGWVAKCNGYASPSATGVTGTTNYNTTIQISGGDAKTIFSTNDGVVLNGDTNTVYRITSIPLSTSIIVTPQPSGNFSNVSVEKVTPKYFKYGTLTD